MIGPSSRLAYGWTQSGTNSNMVQKRPRGRWRDYGDGVLATGKLGLCALRCRLFTIGVMKHRATPTQAAWVISSLEQAPLFALIRDGARAGPLRCMPTLLPIP